MNSKQKERTENGRFKKKQKPPIPDDLDSQLLFYVKYYNEIRFISEVREKLIQGYILADEILALAYSFITNEQESKSIVMKRTIINYNVQQVVQEFETDLKAIGLEKDFNQAIKIYDVQPAYLKQLNEIV